MAIYGSTAGVQDLLASQGINDWSEPELARIQALLPTVSAIIEHETGATFGDAQPETLAVEASWFIGQLLYLPKGLRTLVSVTESPTWSLGAWTGGMLLTGDDYRLTSKTVDGHYHTLYRVNSWWSGTYLVSGLWEDSSDEVPEDIHYLANYLAAEIFKKQKASPAGFVGPDGASVPVRNTFTEPEVKKILAMHRLNRGLVVF